MYAYLRGVIVQKNSDRLIMEVAGVGYNVFISPGRAFEFPACGEETRVYTYTGVREDGISLYGFVSVEELELFKLLINVSGIGPRGALAILSVMGVDEIKYAIIAGDAKLLAKAPGVGKKTAERVIIDLKDKIKADEPEDMTAKAGLDGSWKESSEARDAVDALSALGYSLKDAEYAVSRAMHDLSEQTGKTVQSDELLKLALKYM